MALQTTHLDDPNDVPELALQDLRDAMQRVIDLTVSTGAGTGTALLPYKGRTTEDRLAEKISIRDHGGRDDFNGTNAATCVDNYFALAAIRAAYPGGCKIHFPFVGTGVYRFAYINYDDLNGYEVDADIGVTLRFPSNIVQSSPLARFTRATKTYFENQNVTYWFDANRPSGGLDFFREKKTWLAASDAHDYRAVYFHQSAPVVAFKTFTESSGAYVTSTASSVETADTLLFTSAATTYQLAAYPGTPGQEISFAFRTGGYTGKLCIGVKTHSGIEMYRESANSPTTGGEFHLRDGGSQTTTAVPFTGSATNEQYWAGKARISIRVISARSFSVSVGGVQRLLVRRTKSPIEEIVIGAGSVVGTTRATWLSKIDSRGTESQRDHKLLFIGDSLTAPAITGWPMVTAQLLDGTAGIKVTGVTNLAVAGDRAQQQKDHLDAWLLANPTPDITHAFILVGNNDVQAGTTPADYVTFTAAMVESLLAKNIPVTVGVPPQFYSRALAAAATGFAGQGQNTANYNAGAEHRAALIHKMSVVDFFYPGMTSICMVDKELGNAQSSWLTLPGDALLDDNIHLTDYGRRIVGTGFAKSFLSMYSPKEPANNEPVTIASSWIAAGWVGNAGTRYLQAGQSVTLMGALVRVSGTGAAVGDTLMTVPRNLWPAVETFCVGMAISAGGVRYKPCVLKITVTGLLQNQDLDSASIGVDLSGARYLIA